MDRDNRIIGFQCRGPIGAFGDRQPQQQRVREQTAKPDGDAIFPIAPKNIPRAQKPGQKPRESPGIETAQQQQIKILLQIQRRDGAEQQAGNGEILGEFHQPVHAGIAEIAFPDRQIAKADHEENGQDDVDQRGHWRIPWKTSMPPAGIFRLGSRGKSASARHRRAEHERGFRRQWCRSPDRHAYWSERPDAARPW